MSWSHCRNAAPPGPAGGDELHPQSCQFQLTAGRPQPPTAPCSCPTSGGSGRPARQAGTRQLPGQHRHPPGRPVPGGAALRLSGARHRHRRPGGRQAATSFREPRRAAFYGLAFAPDGRRFYVSGGEYARVRRCSISARLPERPPPHRHRRPESRSIIGGLAVTPTARRCSRPTLLATAWC